LGADSSGFDAQSQLPGSRHELPSIRPDNDPSSNCGQALDYIHPMTTKSQHIQVISKRLLAALGILLGVVLLLIVVCKIFTGVPVVSLFTILVGAIGGFVGLQRRLKQLSAEDIELLASSHLYSFLAPLVGGILALLLYVLFLSGLLEGDLFPAFVPDNETGPADFSSILATHGKDYQAYAKLMFWSFLAGFSERFVIDIISQFEQKGRQG
jgi:hypothetical protein